MSQKRESPTNQQVLVSESVRDEPTAKKPKTDIEVVSSVSTSENGAEEIGDPIISSIDWTEKLDGSFGEIQAEADDSHAAFEKVNTDESTGDTGLLSINENSLTSIGEAESNATSKVVVKAAEHHEMTDVPDDEVEIVQTKFSRTKKKGSMRKDIRKIMTVDQLDEETVAAQREEADRLQRILQKQQHLWREHSSESELLPISIEDVMSFPDYSPEAELGDLDCREINERKDASMSKAEVRREHEVYTLSSDDEETQPSKESSTNSDMPTVIDTNFYSNSGGVVFNGTSNSIIDVIPLDDERSESGGTKEEDSDDDCILLSPPPFEKTNDSDEKNEDELNNSDEFGRVLVNVGHPDDEPDIFVSPKIAKAMKPHQIGGVRFLYDNVVESLDRFEKTSGFGCILAHSMGLGKTIQAAAFCEVFLRCTSARTVLIIVPINTVQNWSHEFKHWLPTEINNSYATSQSSKRKIPPIKKDSSDPEFSNGVIASCGTAEANHEVRICDISPEQSTGTAKQLNLFVLNETIKTLASREKIIAEWGKKGGVLLVGYEMYRMLALRKLRKNGNTKRSFKKGFPNHAELNENQEELLSQIHTYLIRPGPDLVICDEGHRIKNSGASISQALKAIRTRRRVVLTGYPLQNNLMEYWCMVDFIRPNYLGTKVEFSNMFDRPINNGQCVDSTFEDKRLMRFRSHVLHSLLQGFVQRRSHAVLQKALPPKQEFVFLVKMSPIQFQLYKEYVNYIQMQVEMGHSTPNPIKAFAVCSKFWNHPDILYSVMKKESSVNVLIDDLEVEDLADEVKRLKKTAKPDCNENIDNNSYEGQECFYTGESLSSRGSRNSQDRLLSLEWASSVFENYTPGLIENGTKFKLLFIIIEETLKVGDKLLVFSQSLLTLDLMETLFHSKLGWSKGEHYFRLDGSTGGLEREHLINEFNEKEAVKVFLVSTKAGSLGVNLIGANRVLVFDASWNPCHDCQAVCRVYRYGQKKPCYIYRLVNDFTLEKQIYDRQIHKGGMANRVVDEMNPECHFNSKELLSTLLLEIRDLENSQEKVVEHDTDSFLDEVTRSLLAKNGERLTRKPFEHESLLIDQKEKKLTASERRLALRNYELEKKAAANCPNGVMRYPASGKTSPSEDWSMTPSSHSVASSATYQNYLFGGGSVISHGFPPRRIENGVRPYLEDAYCKRHVSSLHGDNGSWSNAVEGLRKKGLLTSQLIALKKNYILPNPKTGDEYLRPGDTIELIRTKRCTYIRISNGQFLAMRSGSKGFTYLEKIPFSQYLSGKQMDIFLSTFLLSTSSSSLRERERYHKSLGFKSRNSPFASHQSSPSSLINCTQSRHLPSDRHPPVSFPLPPTLPYGNFSGHQNGHNFQLSNSMNTSGGDITILKGSKEDESTSRGDIVPEIELIQIGSSGKRHLKNNEYQPTSSFSNRESLSRNMTGRNYSEMLPSFSNLNPPGSRDSLSDPRNNHNHQWFSGNWPSSARSSWNPQLPISLATSQKLKTQIRQRRSQVGIDLDGGHTPSVSSRQPTDIPGSYNFSSSTNTESWLPNNSSNGHHVSTAGNSDMADEFNYNQVRYPPACTSLNDYNNPIFNQYYNQGQSQSIPINNSNVPALSYNQPMLFDDLD